jgi:hypothetical protein
MTRLKKRCVLRDGIRQGEMIMPEMLQRILQRGTSEVGIIPQKLFLYATMSQVMCVRGRGRCQMEIISLGQDLNSDEEPMIVVLVISPCSSPLVSISAVVAATMRETMPVGL